MTRIFGFASPNGLDERRRTLITARRGGYQGSTQLHPWFARRSAPSEATEGHRASRPFLRRGAPETHKLTRGCRSRAAAEARPSGNALVGRPRLRPVV